ncbi:two-component system CitB family response regulator [Crossiella equi]|uniref:Two-component system CitB family response regulator n=1 Tax=Crossiella equi TaxID=130796 RepID=A0ABS5A5L8_9PSEU|nr:response regulator [Crossiella equi]MBP2471886.1 two-component system CitB family response regulator [Crossiella equi]
MGDTAASAVLVVEAGALPPPHLRELRRTSWVRAAHELAAGDDVLDAVELLRPDLVVLPWQRTGADSLQVLRRLRDPGRHQPDVVLTATGLDLASALAARRLGVVCVLRRPFTAADLLVRLEAWWLELWLARTLPDPAQLSQPQLDRLLHRTRASGAATPKGIAPHTLRLVAGALRGSGQELEVKELARSCGLSEVATRRYLNHLTDLGKAELRTRYGSPGRPAGRYHWVG